ncbi:alkylmercury lyase [Mycobacterium sp.]|uniref:alkylmercury lyase n=1 Tax=Mycobacterium sp. TaxID=1785 RepID=UPI0031DCCE64
MLSESLSALGLHAPVSDRLGDFPSLSILIDGVDVMHPGVLPAGRSCRLDLPSRAAIVAALQHATAAEHDEA